MVLAQLSYVSRPSPGTTVEGLDLLVAGAQKKNRGRSLTGMLGFRPGVFAQVLEGDRSIISTLFLRIAADPRHEDVTLVGFEQIRRRRFASWAMTYVSFDALGREHLLEFLPSEELDVSALDHHTLVELLAAIGTVVSDDHRQASRLN